MGGECGREMPGAWLNDWPYSLRGQEGHSNTRILKGLLVIIIAFSPVQCGHVKSKYKVLE